MRTAMWRRGICVAAAIAVASSVTTAHTARAARCGGGAGCQAGQFHETLADILERAGGLQTSVAKVEQALSGDVTFCTAMSSVPAKAKAQARAQQTAAVAGLQRIAMEHVNYAERLDRNVDAFRAAWVDDFRPVQRRAFLKAVQFLASSVYATGTAARQIDAGLGKTLSDDCRPAAAKLVGAQDDLADAKKWLGQARTALAAVGRHVCKRP